MSQETWVSFLALSLPEDILGLTLHQVGLHGFEHPFRSTIPWFATVSVFWLKQLLKHNLLLSIWSFWMPKISFPAVLPILLGGEVWCKAEKSLFSSLLISLWEKAYKASSLEVPGTHFASDSFPFLPFSPPLIPGLKLMGSAWIFFFPKMLKVFD